MAWGVGETGRAGSGDVSGTGSCRAGATTWSLTYSGGWTLSDPDFRSAPCPGDSYDVTLTLRSGPRSRAVHQTWSAGQDRGGAMVALDGQGTPAGAGTLTKSVSPCSVGAGGGFTTSGTWAFAVV